ncbi:MAG: taurine ABC transporter substrate-binding protein [Geminicoccaceae bacterium]|nr:taurine ABC transporter substrate-binding protein [Geminicoccaceae bacterium]
MPRPVPSGSLVAGVAFAVAAAAKEVAIGYQPIYGPWGVPIVAGRFERETGYAIKWVKFDSGAKVATALAAGEIQIGVMGSAPIAAAASGGAEIALFWILAEIAAAEALVVREGAGIDPQDPTTLIGKRMATPFLSTAHFHALVALESWGIEAGRVDLIDMQPYRLATAWQRGEIDAAYVWSPALARIKRSGTVMIDSAVLAEKGRPTFDGIVAARDWAEKNKEFLAKFVKIVAETVEQYRSDRAAWTAESPEVEALVRLFGGWPSDVPAALADYRFSSLEEQASKKWLGGGKESGAARTLAATAAFLKERGRIDAVPPDFAKLVTSAPVEAALKLAR